jgi:hypothetical protein
VIAVVRKEKMFIAIIALKKLIISTSTNITVTITDLIKVSQWAESKLIPGMIQ